MAPSCPKPMFAGQLSLRYGRFIQPITDNWFSMAKHTSMNCSSLFSVVKSVLPGYCPVVNACQTQLAVSCCVFLKWSSVFHYIFFLPD